MKNTSNTISFPGNLIHRTLHGRMLSLMFLLLGALIGITWLMVYIMVSSILEEYIGRNALNVSKAVSLTTVVQEGLKNNKSSKIQMYAESVREATGARFVVVGDHEGLSLIHI